MTIKQIIFLLVLAFFATDSIAQSLEEQLNQEIAEIENSCSRRAAELKNRLESLEKMLFEEQQDLQEALVKGNSVDQIYKSIDLTQGSISSIREELRQINSFKQEQINKAQNLYNGLKKIQDELERQERQKARQTAENAKKQADVEARRERFKAEQDRRRQYEEELTAQRREFLLKMEAQRKAYGNQVRAEIRAENDSRLPQELAAIDRRAHQGQELLEQISTPSKNQYLLDSGLADRVVAGYDSKKDVFVDPKSLKLKNQITLGRLSVNEHIIGDIKGFIKQHLINDYQRPFSEWSFCQEMMEKVCSYYKIDKQKLLMGLCEPEVSDAVTQSLNNYSLAANEQIKALLDRWKTRRNIPQWSILQKGRSSKQMLSLVNIMTVFNKNNLPVPVGSDEKYLYYSLDNTNKIARVERKTSKMEIADGNIAYVLQQSLSNFAISDESKNPTDEISSAFKQKRNLRRYEILEDGAGNEKYIDDLGKTINYSVKAPVLHYMSDSSVVVYNVFSQTEKTSTIRKDEDNISWGYKFAFRNFSFSPKYKISTNGEDQSMSKGKITEGIKVKGLSISATEDSNGGVSENVKIGRSIGLLSGEVSITEDSKGSVSEKLKVGGNTGLINGDVSFSNSNGKKSGEIAGGVKEYGTGLKLSAGVTSTKKEDESYDREAFASVELSLLGFSREVTANFSDNYLQKSEGTNIGYRQLPSFIQNAILLELFAEDEKKSILSFSDKFTSDEYSNRVPMTKTDFQNIKNKVLRDIHEMDIPDYQYSPTVFNPFESCLGKIEN